MSKSNELLLDSHATWGHFLKIGLLHFCVIDLHFGKVLCDLMNFKKKIYYAEQSLTSR